jgi:anaerobic ribonucleoside-triphosphate reductase
LPRTVKQIDKEIKQLKRELKECKGTECEVYTRVVGYYRNPKNFNNGKAAEYKDRKLYKY